SPQALSPPPFGKRGACQTPLSRHAGRGGSCTPLSPGTRERGGGEGRVAESRTLIQSTSSLGSAARLAEAIHEKRPRQYGPRGTGRKTEGCSRAAGRRRR